MFPTGKFNSKRCRRVIRLRIDEHVGSATEMQAKQTVRFGNVQPQNVRIKLLRGGSIVYGKPAERFRVSEHYLAPCCENGTVRNPTDGLDDSGFPMYNQMVMNNSAALDGVFSALGDPTRRAIVERLARGRASISQVAARLPMSQPAISKHVKVLEQSGLVTRKVSGRVHHLSLSEGAMQSASSWIETQQRFWNATLDRLDAYLTSTSDEKERKKS